MEQASRVFGRASAMPAATWHFLKANDTSIEVPGHLRLSSAVQVMASVGVCDTDGAFERALAAAQAAWEQAHPALTPEQRAELEAFTAAEADATYGGTALSAYQMGADALEEMRSLPAAFEHGMGDEVAAYVRYAAGTPVAVVAEAGDAVEAQVAVTAVKDAVSAAAIDVVAGPGSTVDVSLLVGGPAEADADGVRDSDSDGMSAIAGFTGTTVRVFADSGASVRLTRIQTLGDAFADIDDVALFVHDSAHVEVRQTVLGAAEAYTGLAGDLRGEAARVDVDTRYLGRASQKRDFNYVLRHHGQKTRCNLVANGVLAGTCCKTLRGTIDFVRGCRGSEGSERESVLLVDEGVQNKTVPVILCNEDDVAGNHGATIGHIRDEQLFYLASRGLSQEAAESMFVAAVLEQAAIDAPDDASRAAVLQLGERLSPGFAELLEE